MKKQTNSTAPECCAPLSCYASFLGKLRRKWDWWIYCRAFHSMRRMTLDNPGMAYLMELQMREWNEKLSISPELRRATEAFHDSMRDHSQHNDQGDGRRVDGPTSPPTSSPSHPLTC